MKMMKGAKGGKDVTKTPMLPKAKGKSEGMATKSEKSRIKGGMKFAKGKGC